MRLAAKLKTRQLTKNVPAPELDDDENKGSYIVVRKMTAHDRYLMISMLEQCRVKDTDKVIPHYFNTAKLIATMVDDDGNHIAEPDELITIAHNMDEHLFGRLREACDELNPVSDISGAEKKQS